MAYYLLLESILNEKKSGGETVMMLPFHIVSGCKANEMENAEDILVIPR